MQYLDVADLRDGDIESFALPKRSVTLRKWGSGVAAVHGLGGVRLYAASSDLEAHIRVVGVSRDVAFGGEY